MLFVGCNAPIVIPNTVPALSARLAVNILIDETPGVSTLVDLHPARVPGRTRGPVQVLGATEAPGRKPIWVRSVAAVAARAVPSLQPSRTKPSPPSKPSLSVTSIIATGSGAGKIFASLAAGVIFTIILAIVEEGLLDDVQADVVRLEQEHAPRLRLVVVESETATPAASLSVWTGRCRVATVSAQRRCERAGPGESVSGFPNLQYWRLVRLASSRWAPTQPCESTLARARSWQSAHPFVWARVVMDVVADMAAAAHGKWRTRTRAVSEFGSDSEIDDDVAMVRKMTGVANGAHRRFGSRGSRFRLR
ncbi:hypothetical protein M427DRAFT_74326 [Gonapodya prolifera JEL478]|uniref:Uncharacterized protein n=1 Tax=Gonapodya prolifera (strain JEL478) TaxID=1344416 RepID=A0A139A0P6_GONPJ|nr:hypothetical protein M427DRAFT_74326 [Gonapodya prolifera JEL478]|eukprot:KXS10357.1 hypothetical protein M427DRAFT_74326 [Gonapodya prolifera JEL478]